MLRIFRWGKRLDIRIEEPVLQRSIVKRAFLNGLIKKAQIHGQFSLGGQTFEVGPALNSTSGRIGQFLRFAGVLGAESMG